MTLAPRVEVSHMCLMGMLVFLPGLHLLHSIPTHTRQAWCGGAVELGRRLWNWWSCRPRLRRGILIFTTRREGQSNARWHVLTLAAHIL